MRCTLTTDRMWNGFCWRTLRFNTQTLHLFGNRNAYRTNFNTGTTHGTRSRQIACCIQAQQMRRDNLANRAGISRTVSRATDTGINRTMVHTRTATDTLQGTAHLIFCIRLATSVIKQYQVHFLRAVQLFATARAGNHIEISGNVLTNGGAWQQTVQRRNIRQLRNHFFNTGNGNVHRRYSGTQAAVTFVFDQTQSACFRNGKVHTAQTDIGSAVNIAQGFTGEAGQLVYIVC